MSGHCPACGRTYRLGPPTPRRCRTCLDRQASAWDRADLADLMTTPPQPDDSRWWVIGELNRRIVRREQLAA